MLDVDNAIPFLLERGWINPEWVVDGDLTIRSRARRNRNLSAEGPNHLGYLIKQPDELASEGHRTLRAEAAFYDFCQQEPAASAVARFLPRMVYRETDRALHVLELVPRAMTLGAHHGSSDALAFPIDASRLLGEALGTLHRVFRLPGLAQDPRLDWLTRPMPWVFSAHRPWPGLLANMSPAGARVLQIIQEHEGLDAHLDRLRTQWRTETIIHGDLKSDNVLVRRSTSSERARTKVWLVDWELAQLGDPAWDLAGALHDFLLLWTASMPLNPELSTEERITQARYPLDALRPAARSFWEGYQSSAALAPGAADDLMLRAVAFSGARLILAAYEMSAEQVELSALTVLLLQISANLLANPVLGQVHLYGILRGSIPT
jgi:hypothetical protein